MKKVVTLGSLAALALPFISLAEDINDISGLGSFIIDTINNVIVPVLFAVAFIVFLWGAFTTFILGAGSEEAKDKGKSLMLYSLIGFFVMVSIWGLVNILVGSIGLNNSGPAGGIPSAGVDIQ